MPKLNFLTKHFLFFPLATLVAVFCICCVPHAASAEAGDLTVEFSHTPLFQEIGVMPGDMTHESITVTNNSSEQKTIGMKFIGTSTHELDEKLFFTVSKSGNILFGGPADPKSLSALLAVGEINLLDINPGETIIFYIDAYFDIDSPNEYQLKSSVFDIEVGFIYFPLTTIRKPSIVRVDPITTAPPVTNGQILGEETEIVPPNPSEEQIQILGITLPITGHQLNEILIIAASVIIIGAGLLLISRGRTNEKKSA
ncbi:MAG: LPXTG cell wall anchor domain-containing protein [Patescibacteria group bacterium]